ncbi:MAG: hypothetical protein ABIJ86_03545 [Spirochaetota bacterium]
MGFGDLPGIAVLQSDDEKADILSAYATVYLEEEIRRETGIASATVKACYQLLEDIFIGFTVSAFSGSSRKSALSSPRFFFFDLGVRNAAAGIPLTEDSVNALPGHRISRISPSYSLSDGRPRVPKTSARQPDINPAGGFFFINHIRKQATVHTSGKTGLFTITGYNWACQWV